MRNSVSGSSNASFAGYAAFSQQTVRLKVRGVMQSGNTNIPPTRRAGWTEEQSRNFQRVMDWLKGMTVMHRSQVFTAMGEYYCLSCGKPLESRSSACLTCLGEKYT